MSDREERQRMMAGAFDEALDEEGFAPEGFEIIDELDRGGMAVVYLAQQLEPMREVALKVVLPRFAGEDEVRERFKREGRAMAALEHPGVLPVHQVGEWDDLAFIAMKLASGGTLQAVLKEGLPEIRKVVDWLIAAGEAVHFAHQRGVLHRDLKPGNLLFDEEGAIYVGDFGVAKLEFAQDGGLTRTEALVGTPNYLAPEVASGEASRGNVAADQYGLGAVLYECLTGRRPHEGAENLAAQLRAVADDDVVPLQKLRPEIPRDLAVICEKALAKKPEERYRSVAGFVEDLQRWRDGREILARPAGLPERVWRWVKRHPLPSTLAALLVLSVVTGSGLVLAKLHESLIERAKAERLVQDPGFRQRALNLLDEADVIWSSERIREEAVATLAYWDVDGESDWSPTGDDGPFEVKEVEGGVQVVRKSTGQQEWFIPIPGERYERALRCAPAWSAGGRFLALVLGLKMEVIIYDVSRRKEFANVRVGGWPERLEFSEKDDVLKVIFSEGRSSLLTVRGKVLLEAFSEADHLRKPIGFSVWSGQSLTQVESNPYGGELSESGRFLVTRSEVGVQIWDVERRRAVDFYEVENQLTDAPVDAWWLEDRLLVQVPGDLEILKIERNGKVSGKEEFKRVAGAKVKDVLEGGDWVVEKMDEDEDGNTTIQQLLWKGGDDEKVEEWQGSIAESNVSHEGGVVLYGEWTLTLPKGGEVLAVFPLSESERIVVLTKDYQVCEWDLKVLREELERLSF